VFFLSILVSIAGSIVYGVLRRDWVVALAIGSFAILCNTLLLILFSAAKFLGLDKFVDDEIDEEKEQIPFGNLEEPSQRYQGHGQDNHDSGAHLGSAGQEPK
jgi:hypothetical protein